MSDVLIRVENKLGRITLNRPRALNALTLEMVQAVDAALQAWQADSAVQAVLIDGAGERGLCAGGDIRALYDAALVGDLSFPQAFFCAEYRMNARIAAYPKPYIALMDGIVMGGGIGISAHGSLRIVTEKSRLAMPETGIGFIPDVGGTRLLSHAPDGFGIHAALTAGQMGAADAIACGLADLHILSERLPDLVAGLIKYDGGESLGEIAQHYASAPSPGIFAEHQSWMQIAYAEKTVEAILARIPLEAAQFSSDIQRKSPTSLKLTLRALQEAALLPSLNAALEQEYRLALAIMKSADFCEGVRAAVVDKDRNPRWAPATLAEVTDQQIDGFFNAPNFGGLGLI